MKAAAARFAIKSIRAYLYYHSRGQLDDKRGQFDDADILTGKVGLRNIGGGEGDALAPSSAVLVLVDVEGPDFAKSVPGSAFLNVSAHSDGRRLGGARLKADVLEAWHEKFGAKTLAVIAPGHVIFAYDGSEH